MSYKSDVGNESVIIPSQIFTIWLLLFWVIHSLPLVPQPRVWKWIVVLSCFSIKTFVIILSLISQLLSSLFLVILGCWKMSNSNSACPLVTFVPLLSFYSNKYIAISLFKWKKCIAMEWCNHSTRNVHIVFHLSPFFCLIIKSQDSNFEVVPQVLGL